MEDQQKRRLRLLGTVVLGAVVAVVVAIVVSSGGSDKVAPKLKQGSAVAGRADVSAMLAGIPQSGITLGNPKAKVTMIEFADLQCPICQQYSLQILPAVIQQYVRTGKVKMELRLVNILDQDTTGDSTRMAKVAYGAQAQDKLWDFADLVYFNQGQEHTGYATDAYIRKIAGAVPGLDVAKAFAARNTPEATAALGAATTLFGRYGVKGTPTLMIGRTGGEMKMLDGISPQNIEQTVDALLT